MDGSRSVDGGPSGRFTMDVPGRPEYASTARLFASSIARHFGCDGDDVEDLKVAISEAVAFASRTGDAGPLRLSIQSHNGSLMLDVEHESGFDALLPGTPPADDETEFGRTLLESLFPDMYVEGHAGRGARVTFRLALPPA